MMPRETQKVWHLWPALRRHLGAEPVEALRERKVGFERLFIGLRWADERSRSFDSALASLITQIDDLPPLRRANASGRRQQGARGRAGRDCAAADHSARLVSGATASGSGISPCLARTLPDLLAAVAAGFLSAVAAVATRRIIGGHWRPRARWTLWLPVIVAKAVTDTARAFALVARHVVHRDIDTSCGEAPVGRGAAHEVAIHQALASLAITRTPGAVVYDADPDGNRLFKHELVGGPPDLEGPVGK